MIWLASVLFGIAALATALFRPALAWAVLSVPLLWMLMLWLVLRSKKLGPLPKLSPAGNEMLRKFGHYYAHRFAGAAYSSAASGISFVAVLVAVIGAVKGFLWGLGLGLLTYSMAALLARQFNPTRFLKDEGERAAHEEVVNLVQASRPQGGPG